MNNPTREDLKVFILIWSFIFLLISVYPLFIGQNVRVWSVVISIIFILVAFIRPTLFKGFYRVWIRIGDFIGNIISKSVLFILFFGLFTPISVILKLFGKDLLRKKINKNKSTYWIEREIQPQPMKNQF